MYHLWFDPCSAKTGIHSVMSIRSHLNQVAARFNSHTYPSTTYRIPSDIRRYNKYKANEFRMSILQGYKYVMFSYFFLKSSSVKNRAFENILDKDRYDHYRTLVFATHLLESAQHTIDTHEQIQMLLSKFDKDFVRLYTVNSTLRKLGNVCTL
jgi:hypothetical protein